MNEHLMQAVIEAVVFLATADDDTVDPDAAVQQLEHVGHVLNQLTGDEQREFTAFARRLADEADSRGADERAGALRTLPENLGLEAA